MSERKTVPEGASAVIPRLFCHDPVAEVEFCVAAFHAEERVRRPGPDGTLAHALITIGPAMVMIESEWPEAPNRAPKSRRQHSSGPLCVRRRRRRNS
jgi:PhnB protein